ncbi:MAG: hypothetical protein ACXABY_09260 [Candidatus Thorarchaeota archaeon]|jgi:hypothetical protein
MTDAAARYQSLDGQSQVTHNLVYNPTSGNWELEQQAVIEAITGNLYLAVDEVESLLTSVVSQTIGSELNTGNSTTTPLGIGAVFTGTAVDILGYVSVGVSVFANQASADEGLSLQFSHDNANWDFVDTFDITANEAYRIIEPVMGRYFRIVYTNGAVAQTAFRMQCILYTSTPPPTQVRVDSVLSEQIVAAVSKSVLVGETTAGGGGYVNVKVSPVGALSVELEIVEDSLQDYHFYGWEIDTGVIYVGYQDKGAAWYVKKIDPAAGTVTYAAGASAPPAVADFSTQSFDAFNVKF